MLHPSTKRLIDKLSDMTRKQRVTWTEGESGAVVHDTEGYRVIITPEPHAVLLTDALGREIETCRPEDFADETDSHGRPYAKFVAELFREASRHARGTEKAIRTLLAGLDEAEKEAAPIAAAVAPVLTLVDAPDATTDETTTIESETEITAAVATLAGQINSAAPEPVAVQQPEPVREAAPEPVPEPAPEPAYVAEFSPEPEPEPVAEVTPEVTQTASEAEDAVPPAEEPGAFGTFGAFQPVTAAAEPEPAPPAPEPLPIPLPEPAPVFAEAAPEPEPAIEVAQQEAPEPASEPAPAVPTLSQPISLSSIPFGFGLGAAQRAGAPSHPSTSTPEPQPATSEDAPKRIVIDGTLDLPDITPEELDALSAADPYPPPTPRTDPLEMPGDASGPAPEPVNPRRFNPWN